ncbi:hypothetical protein T03_16239 [Trichinella britovi]|uniref:Uncharacterized protein n=2 Tax=Trichinella TaxID=6333 RepID=A0A0V1DAN6_TRIBR|nr:hypothetical protein T05_5240 [Trichinella murrelli]KRY58374.1 hypothetical protein T03_16239 [Trichinella britovi]KRZ92440.1 hypothetical protein T08_12890 [Trichinella sp. T8]
MKVRNTVWVEPVSPGLECQFEPERLCSLPNSE